MLGRAPHQARAGARVPHVFLPEYQVTVPGYEAWRHVPSLAWNHFFRRIKLTDRWADDYRDRFAAPSGSELSPGRRPPETLGTPSSRSFTNVRRPAPSGVPSAVVARDHLAACLLLVLAETPAHGYELTTLLAPLGIEVSDRGSLYRCLRSLEDDGLVASGWDASPSGPARRIYEVTPTGEAWAAAAADGFRQADRHMAAYLARYRRLRRQGPVRPLGDVSVAG